MGKFCNSGISNFRRHIKNPRTSHKLKFNFLLRDVLGFLFFWFMLQEYGVAMYANNKHNELTVDVTTAVDMYPVSTTT